MADPFADLDPMVKSSPYRTSPSIPGSNQKMQPTAPTAPFQNTFKPNSPMNSNYPTQIPQQPMMMATGLNPMYYNTNQMYPTNQMYQNLGQGSITPQQAPIYASHATSPVFQNSQKIPMNPFYQAPLNKPTPMEQKQSENPFEIFNTTTTNVQVRNAKPTLDTSCFSSDFTTSSSVYSPIVVDFDPFSPRENESDDPFGFGQEPPKSSSQSTSTSTALDERLKKTSKTQEDQRNQLKIPSLTPASGGVSPVARRPLPTSPVAKHPQASRQDDFAAFDSHVDSNATYEGIDDDDFDGSNFVNPDDETCQGENALNKWSIDTPKHQKKLGPMKKDEYEVEFAKGKKLGVLLERIDNYMDGKGTRGEAAVIKLVVENGAADHAGVQVGSIIVGINNRDVGREVYSSILEQVRSAPRPLNIRLKHMPQEKDTTQGNILARISAGTFSVGNLTQGNARWTPKYFALGGSRLDILQLFISRAAYHECVIALYEKRGIHSQIQSFQLNKEHKITPMKSKVYKGYGNLHYFALNVPSLHFVAAKFASEEYEVIKNLWTRIHDAIESRKRS